MLVAKLKGKSFLNGNTKQPIYVGPNGQAMELKEQAKKFETEEEGRSFIRHMPGHEGTPPEVDFETA